MLYVFHGTDTHTAVTKATSLVASLRAKRPDAAYERVEADTWSRGKIEGHLGGQGLFSSKYIVFLDRVTENAEAEEQLADLASALAESDNIFIVLEGKPTAELKKAFEKHAEKVVEVVGNSKLKTQNSKHGEFSIFALVDAVGERNAFKAWSIYREAVDRGNEPESVIGTLFWQVKSMKVASVASSAGAAGLSPFVFSKAKKGAEKYSAQELDHLMERLIVIYHDAHRGLCDPELAIERVMLGLKK